MRPNSSYWIWFSPRTGSTLLCELLTSTKAAGRPQEHFNIEAENGIGMAQKYKVSNYAELRQKIWDLGATPNGVCAVKSSLFAARWDPLCEEMKALLLEDGNLPGTSDPDFVPPALTVGPNLRGTFGPAEVQKNSFQVLWGDLFPNCKHIFLSRRNKVRQAVSWWKAIKNESWHLREGENQQDDAAFYEQHYDFDALSHLFREAVLREAATQAYFLENDIQPFNLFYEDFIQDISGTIQRIFRYLDLELVNLAEIKSSLRRTATDNSEIWVQRFRADLQAKWDKQSW
ncbi:MAG: Stf0 family sulfotransferase [Bacteroidota bacterium]